MTDVVMAPADTLAAAETKEEDRVIPERWWENFWFREGAHVEVNAEGEW